MALAGASAADAQAAAKRSRVDLAVTRVAPVAGPVTPGGRLGLQVTVANRGSRSVGGWRLRVQLLPPRAKPVVLSATHARLRTLKRRKRATVSLRVSLPRTLATGTHGARVCVIVPKRLRERKRGNNCRSVARALGVADADRVAPALALTAPVEGEFVRIPRVTIRGTVSDPGSGVASLSCAGRALAVTAAFSCEAELHEGPNELVVRAVDRAGNPSERRVTVDHFPGGLAGAPGSGALAASVDVLAPGAFVTDAEVTDGVVRTQLELAFAKGATVGQVNAVLRRVGGSIVSQLSGVLILTVRIPDPGSLAALDAIVAGLGGEPALRRTDQVVELQQDLLPNVLAPGLEAAVIDHHFAVRAPAAWNARAAVGEAPMLLLYDSFGAGAPRQFDSIIDADFATGNPATGHGYHVLGIAAGAFDFGGGGLSAAAEEVTGMFPGTPPLRAVDQRGTLSASADLNEVVGLIRSAPGNVVLNTSLGNDCDTPEEMERNCSLAQTRVEALGWIERVRGTDPNSPSFNVEGKFVHATSAGNVENIALGRLPLGAMTNSPWAAAALAPLVDASTGEPVANLTNMFVVENFSAPASEPFRPGCVDARSEIGGTIGAIGENVISFVSPTGTGVKSGTSMATPQVAGLAAYVWALRPDLTTGELVSLLDRTAAPTAPGCGNGTVIDAYAAVLAADEGNLADMPVRRALLDVVNSNGELTPDGTFDQHDITRFIDEFAGVPATAVQYDRFDLNGDGHTGIDTDPPGRDRFDLDADGSYGLDEREIEGLKVRFDESSLTDHKILCNLAYGSLYANSEAATTARTEELGIEGCLNLGLDASFPATVQTLENNPLTITARDLDLPAAINPQDGVFLEFSATGGEVADATGTTDADGRFATDAFILPDQPQLAITIIARANENGEELARTTVVAANADSEPPPGCAASPCEFGGVWKRTDARFQGPPEVQTFQSADFPDAERPYGHPQLATVCCFETDPPDRLRFLCDTGLLLAINANITSTSGSFSGTVSNLEANCLGAAGGSTVSGSFVLGGSLSFTLQDPRGITLEFSGAAR